MPLTNDMLYVGTDISEKTNRTRFYDAAGTEVGRRVESANDLLPSSESLAEEALRRAAEIGAREILWGFLRPPTSSGGTWPASSPPIPGSLSED